MKSNSEKLKKERRSSGLILTWSHILHNNILFGTKVSNILGLIRKWKGFCLYLSYINRDKVRNC